MMSTAPSELSDRDPSHLARRSIPHATHLSVAPGRVNLIGEHTDYNDGFVAPMALPFVTSIAAEASPDPRAVQVESTGFGEARFVVGEVDDDLPGWTRYLAGCAAVLLDEGHDIRGWRGAIATDIPTGASLSSSAALEVATINLFCSMSGIALDGPTVARLGQRVENEIMNLQTGIMDQFISANAVAGHVSVIDCRSLTQRPAPVPGVVAVIDTGSRRELVDSEYDLRRASCERAADAIGVRALRDATLDDLAAVGDPTDHRRATHVINENERVLAAADAMDAGDADTLGRLMNESHKSLRDLYEVSGPELNAAVEMAQNIPGCHGARMTGGGFAGCCVALLDPGQTDSFVDAFMPQWQASMESQATVWMCEPSHGAGVVPLNQSPTPVDS